jgi:putative spermidine/putrescine transport system ATP-binding protein/spermidine/putrescine transport system ATP-binding protein
VTHDQGEALSMSDRIAIMRAGRIEQLADADTVYARPASAYVAAFVGQQNFFRGPAAEAGAAITSPYALVRAASPVLTSTSLGEAAVRPEFIRIEKDAPAGSPAEALPGANTARGELLGVSHLGDTMQYLVRLGADQSLIVRRPTPDAPALSVGDPVVCTWAAHHVLLFPAADDDAAKQGGYIAPPTA